MKTTAKKIATMGLSGLLIILTLQSCNKYPDGPSVSTKSRKERVANVWIVDNYKINDIDLTSLVTNYSETFSKSGDYSYSFGLLDGIGNWKFQNKDKEIQLTGSDNQTSHTLIILKLEEKSFWYYYIEGNDKYEFHLIEQ